jgi:hypothetical protein
LNWELGKNFKKKSKRPRFKVKIKKSVNYGIKTQNKK